MGPPEMREPRAARAATALVFAGGDPPSPGTTPNLEADLVIAAGEDERSHRARSTRFAHLRWSHASLRRHYPVQVRGVGDA